MNKRRLEFRIRRLTARLRMLPDFLIIGAQKSGTTSLYNHLVQHPSVGCAFEKEVRYFNDHYGKGVNWYRAHFPTSPLKQVQTLRYRTRYITGEGEPSYLANPLAPQRVLDLVPDVKLIVMLRNPVDRAYSHYQHRFTRNRETRPFEEVVSADKKVLLDGFDGLPTGDGKRLGHLHYSYLPRGFYAEQLENWFAVFPQGQFKIIHAEEFFADTQKVYDEVLEFLSLPGRTLQKKKKYYEGTYSQPISDETRRDLVEYFAPHNRRLYDLLQRDFAWDT